MICAVPILVLSLWSSTTQAASSPDLVARTRAAAQAMRDGRFEEAANMYREVTQLAPKAPSSWYALGQAYNAIKQDALGTFGDQPEDAAWRQLLIADALLSGGQLTD